MSTTPTLTALSDSYVDEVRAGFLAYRAGKPCDDNSSRAWYDGWCLAEREHKRSLDHPAWAHPEATAPRQTGGGR